MNILISYNWLKDYLKTDLSAHDFAKMTTNAGNSVEYIHDLSLRFENFVVGEVKEINVHPNANKLKLAVTKISKTKTVEIVCGGINLAQGQKVVVALPGAKVNWHGAAELTELHETEIRGVKSHGMICAASECGFEKYPEKPGEIWDISNLTAAGPGTPISQALELADTVFDVEVTSNRPDCMSIIGQAREGSAITGDKFTWAPPTPLLSSEASAKEDTPPAPLSVSVDSPLCTKYQAIVLDNVKVGPSPWWLQKALLLAGHRPINNIVDITNYVLHEYGQPLHAFDADKLQGDKIVVRTAKKGEKIKALDGNEYELDSIMLVIADTKKPVAIAGVMGGEETGTTEDTTRIVIESATFDPVSIRKTSRALNLHSDSSQLFEKGLSIESTNTALLRAAELVQEVAGGKIVSPVITEASGEFQPKTFTFNPAKANALIGVEIAEKEMVGMLERLGFMLEKKGKDYQITVPHWRDLDITDWQDFVEEIARLYGYDKIPAQMPKGAIARFEIEPQIEWERRIKELLVGSGLSEFYGFAFISESELERYGLPLESAVAIENPLSSDQSHLRPSLVPTMLTAIEANQARFHDGALFEIAPTYHPKKDEIPLHQMRLLIAVYGKDGYDSFRKAKGIMERLLAEVGIRKFRLERGVDDSRLHPGRCAYVWVGQHETIGTIGQVAKATASAFDLDQDVVLIDLDFQLLTKYCTTLKIYTPIPLYPEVKRDLAFVVEDCVEYDDLKELIHKTSGLVEDLEIFDIYRGKGVETGKKSMAIHLSFRVDDRTLEADEVENDLSKIKKVLADKFHAIIR